MRHANLETSGKESGETILIVNKEEGRLLVEGLEALCKLHPRRAKQARLLREIQMLAVF